MFPRLKFWARKSISDKRARPIFSFLLGRFIEKMRKENSHFTEPELKNGNYHRHYPKFEEEVKEKRSFNYLKMLMP